MAQFVKRTNECFSYYHKKKQSQAVENKTKQPTTGYAMSLFHSHLFACLHQEENVKVACGGRLCCANSTKHPDNIVIGRSRRYAVNIYLYLKFFFPATICCFYYCVCLLFAYAKFAGYTIRQINGAYANL